MGGGGTGGKHAWGGGESTRVLYVFLYAVSSLAIINSVDIHWSKLFIFENSLVAESLSKLNNFGHLLLLLHCF